VVYNGIQTHQRLMNDGVIGGVEEIPSTTSVHGYDVTSMYSIDRDQWTIQIEPTRKPGAPAPFYRGRGNPDETLAVFRDFFLAMDRLRAAGKSLDHLIYAVGFRPSHTAPFPFMLFEGGRVSGLKVERNPADLNPFLSEDELQGLTSEDVGIASAIHKSLAPGFLADKVDLIVRVYAEKDDLWMVLPIPTRR
jgi:hypothetical protein